MRRIALIVTSILLIGLAACTPAQVELFHSLAPEDQAKVVSELQRQQAERPRDCYSAMERVFPSHAHGRMAAIIHRESRNNPRAQNPSSSAAGCTQTLSLHAPRYRKLGYTWEHDRYDAYANLRVAHDLWLEAGWSPWSLTAY